MVLTRVAIGWRYAEALTARHRRRARGRSSGACVGLNMDLDGIVTARRWPIGGSWLVALGAGGPVWRRSARIRPSRGPRQLPPPGAALAEGRGFVWNGRPTAYRPPLYPLVLAPLVAVLGDASCAWGVAVLHLALGAATVLLTAWPRRAGGSRPARSCWRRRSWRVDPVLVAQGRMVMTETLAALLARGDPGGTRPPGDGAARRWGGARFGLAACAGRARCRRPCCVGGRGRWSRPRDGWHGSAARDDPGDRDGRDARPVGLAERPRLRRAGLDDDARRLHARPGEQPDLLRRGPRRPARQPSGRARTRSAGSMRSTRTGRDDEPDADRRLRSLRLQLLRDGPATSPGPRWRGWPVLERRTLRRGVSPRPPRSRAALWTVPLWVALVAGLSPRDLVLAPDRGPRDASRAVGGPCVLLDRHADASPARAGHRPDRRARARAPHTVGSATTGLRPHNLSKKSRKKIENPAGFCCSNLGETLG